MNKFLSFLKTALNIGQTAVPLILNTVSPGTGAIVQAGLSAILNAEALFGSGDGQKKMDAALTTMQVAAPGLIKLIEVQTGKQLANEELFAEGIRELTEGLVKILNSFSLLLPKK
jgi:hypothetical protein